MYQRANNARIVAAHNVANQAIEIQKSTSRRPIRPPETNEIRQSIHVIDLHHATP